MDHGPWSIDRLLRMKYILETERLRLREFTLEDSDFIIELLNSPGWLEFIGDRNVRTADQARSYLENGPMKSYRENGFGLSMVEMKDYKKPIGMCGILKRDSLEYPDIGFAFLPTFQGEGYAYEIASQTLSYARQHLKIPKIAAITVPKNEKSIRLLQKIGLHFERTITLPGGSEELLLYTAEFG